MKGKASNKAKAKNKFKQEDKVFAMDGGDLYEAKVGIFLQSTACLMCPAVLVYCLRVLAGFSRVGRENQVLICLYFVLS